MANFLFRVRHADATYAREIKLRPLLNSKFMKNAILTVLVALALLVPITAQLTDELGAYNEPPSRLRGVIEKFGQDHGSINRFYTAQTSATRSAKFRGLYADYLSLLGRVNFNSLNHDEQIDYVLFENYLDHEQKELGRFDRQLAEMAPILPFSRVISDLEDARRRLEPTDPAKAATVLTDLAKQISRFGFSALRIFLNGNNLWVWSRMPDDRESNFAGAGSQGAYPTVKRYNLGLRLTF